MSHWQCAVFLDHVSLSTLQALKPDYCCIGAERKKYILYVTVLLSARLQAVHDTAKLDLLRSMSGSAHQQVWCIASLSPYSKVASII